MRQKSQVDDKDGYKRELRLFAVTPELKMFLLLIDRDRKILDPCSFYTMINVKSKHFNKQEKLDYD